MLELIYTSLVAALLITSIGKLSFFRNSQINLNFLKIAFVLKFCASIALAYVYTYQYPDRSEADIFKYFDDSQVIHEILSENTIDYFSLMTGIGIDEERYLETYYTEMNNWVRAYDSNVFNDSHTIIRFNAFFRWFSFGIYEIHSLLFCYLSLIGFVAIFRFLNKYLGELNHLFLMLLFFLPNLFIWTSGNLKESILVFGIGTLLFLIGQSLNSSNIKRYLPWTILGVLLLIFIKFYVLLALSIPLIAFIWIEKNPKTSLWIYPILLAISLFVGFNSGSIHETIDLPKIFDLKQSDFVRLAEWQSAGSSFELSDIEPNFMGILKVVPEGIFNCFFRPLPWNVSGAQYYPSIIENFLILLLIGVAVFTWVKTRSFFSKSQQNIIIFSILFVILLFGLVGITTPVAGALVRYKVPALPFLLFVLIILGKESSFLKSIELDLVKLKLLR